jgi:hypothetical protein
MIVDFLDYFLAIKMANFMSILTERTLLKWF